MALDRVHLSFDRNKRNGSLIFLLFKHEAIERARKAGQGTISGSVAQNEVRPAMKSFAQSKKRKKERKKENGQVLRENNINAVLNRGRPSVCLQPFIPYVSCSK